MTPDAIIKQIENFQLELFEKSERGVVIAPPHKVGPVAIKMRTLILQLVDHVYDMELEYRKMKAAKFDKNIKSGLSKSASIDALDYDNEVIELKVGVERLKNYMKYADSLVSAAQSYLKSQSFNTDL